MRISILKTMFICAVAAAACNQKHTPDAQDGLAAFSAENLRKDIAMLASDSFMGRMPFTEGETRTIGYLEQQFRTIGMEPGNGNSYVQAVPMVNILAMADPEMTVKSAKGSFTLKAFNDYVISTDKTTPEIRLENTDLVFAGYGVVAPEYNWNDYEGLDVKGKIVMVMVNDPGFWSGDTTLFRGNTMTYYGRWTYKFEEAARQGAKGCLIVHNTKAAGYPFNVPQQSFNTSGLQLDNRGKNLQICDVNGWITENAAHTLLKAAGYDAGLLTKANQPGFKGMPLNLQLSTGMTVTATYNKSYNVIAKITGSKHPDEVIIYTAHWDHLGIGRPDSTGDSIYNGALDNASGTAGLLELARAFKSLKTPPERSIVIMAVTGEEQGLLGSKYYAENPVYPAGKTVANINMDGLNPYGKTHDIIIIGEGQSDLEDYLKTEVEQQGGYVSFDTHAEAGSYYRSDHFNFAKVGIPALYTSNGIDVIGKGKEYGQKIDDDYTAFNYHQPSDEFDPATWSMEGGIHDLQLLFLVGKRMAFEETWPQWKTTSEFKSIRDKK
jgi:Zn-dependent M28 family amino/carboxypeptidase